MIYYIMFITGIYIITSLYLLHKLDMCNRLINRYEKHINLKNNKYKWIKDKK